MTGRDIVDGMTDSHSKAEIERQFLLEESEELAEILRTNPGVTIRQGYLSLDSINEIRVREYGGSWWLTCKGGSGLERLETEVKLAKEQFDALWPLTVGKRIFKNRHSFAQASSVFEIDIYSGELEGLRSVEVEFPSREASETFIAPSWFGREVTYDEAYKNKNLACHGVPR